MRTPACIDCGSTRFNFYQTITEAAAVQSFDDDGAALIDDSWEGVDTIDSEIRCENGHTLSCDPDSESGWTGDAIDAAQYGGIAAGAQS